MTTEEVYHRLLPLAVVIEVDCGSGAGGDRRGWEQPITDEQQDGSMASDDAEVVREETARKVRARAERGDTVSPALASWAGQYLEPSVDWRAELRSVVSRRLGQRAGTTDYTVTHPSRRRVPGFTLPGMAGPAPPRVAAVIDTSGSMTTEELAQCLGDLLGLVRSVSGDGATVTVMTVDMQVIDVVTVRRPADVPGLRLRGGGGTNMVVGLEACAGLRPVPEVVIVMTDGETPWPPKAPAGLEGAAVIALLSQPETAAGVPRWMRAVPMA
jgi:predicted metal-dependent peptidase